MKIRHTRAGDIADLQTVLAETDLSHPQNSNWNCHAGVCLGETTTTEMAWFKIGNAQFITHPGETPPSYSMASKELMNTEPKFVLGLGLDAMGYILEPKFFEDPTVPHAEYLTRMSPGPDAGPKVMTVAEGLIPN